MARAILDPGAVDETDYNPEKARIYRLTFQARDPNGRTWSQHINAWRQQHPEYRERASEYTAKSRLIAKRGVKKLLRMWGLSQEQTSRFLRLISVEQVDCIVDCVRSWDHLSGKASRTATTLLRFVHQRHSASTTGDGGNREQAARSRREVFEPASEGLAYRTTGEGGGKKGVAEKTDNLIAWGDL